MSVGQYPDSSGSITANELCTLTFTGSTRLSAKTCGMLIKAFDEGTYENVLDLQRIDRSGSLEFQEFATLHGFVQRLKNSYDSADKGMNRCWLLPTLLRISHNFRL